jgi:hypothetical protein
MGDPNLRPGGACSVTNRGSAFFPRHDRTGPLAPTSVCCPAETARFFVGGQCFGIGIAGYWNFTFDGMSRIRDY